MNIRGLSEAEQFEFTLLRVAAVIASQNPDDATTWYCVPKSSEAVLDAMRRLFFRSVPSSDCDLEGDEDPRDTGGHLVHKPTRQRAVQLNTGQKYVGHDPSSDHPGIPQRTLGADEREVKLGYYVGPMYAEGWTCVLRKTREGWAPMSCRRVWMS